MPFSLGDVAERVLTFEGPYIGISFTESSMLVSVTLDAGSPVGGTYDGPVAGLWGYDGVEGSYAGFAGFEGSYAGFVVTGSATPMPEVPVPELPALPPVKVVTTNSPRTATMRMTIRKTPISISLKIFSESNAFAPAILPDCDFFVIFLRMLSDVCYPMFSDAVAGNKGKTVPQLTAFFGSRNIIPVITVPTLRP